MKKKGKTELNISGFKLKSPPGDYSLGMKGAREEERAQTSHPKGGETSK